MNKFKVGDWVTVEGTLPDDKFQLTVDEIKNKEILLAHFSFAEDKWEHWKPTVGEWCWFWDVYMGTPQLHKFQCYSTNEQLDLEERYVEEGSDSDSWGFDYCEPFIGVLPSTIK